MSLRLPDHLGDIHRHAVKRRRHARKAKVRERKLREACKRAAAAGHTEAEIAKATK